MKNRSKGSIWLNRMARTYWQFRYRQIEAGLNDPINAQYQVLQGLINKAQATSFGQSHHFREISDIESFQSAVPLAQYADLAPQIYQMMAGEPDVLWPGTIHDFGRTAGTSSNEAKYIPLSMEVLQNNHSRGSRDIMSFYCKRFPQTDVFTGKGLILGGTFYQNSDFPKARIGDISAFMVKYMPQLASLVLFPGKSITLLPNWEEKIRIIAQQSIHQKITNITGMPTWMLIFAREVCRISGKKNLLEVWPDLQVFNHGGMSFDLYQPLFEGLLPSKQVFYHDIYNATEGFFAFKDDPDASGMRLLTQNGVFYEFRSISDPGKILSLEQVELAEPYALIISNCGGLWRYEQGDVIEFTELNPFRIRILGRINQCLNHFGEMLEQVHLDHAISEIRKQTSLRVQDFTVLSSKPDHSGTGKHTWFLELEHSAPVPNQLSDLIDQALSSVNSNYRKRRQESVVLLKPEVQILAPGTILNWHRHRGQVGGQSKLPRIMLHDESFKSFIASTQ